MRSQSPPTRMGLTRLKHRIKNQTQAKHKEILSKTKLIVISYSWSQYTRPTVKFKSSVVDVVGASSMNEKTNRANVFDSQMNFNLRISLKRIFMFSG